MDRHDEDSSSAVLPEMTVADIKQALRIPEKDPHAIAEGQPPRSSLFYALGVRLSKTFIESGDVGDLDESIQVLREAVHATSPGHADPVSRLTLLQDRFGGKFSKMRIKVYHDEANKLKQEIIETIFRDDPNRTG